MVEEHNDTSILKYWGALYKKLRFVNVRNMGTNLGVGTTEKRAMQKAELARSVPS